jgi:hypothetical protein
MVKPWCFFFLVVAVAAQPRRPRDLELLFLGQAGCWGAAVRGAQPAQPYGRVFACIRFDRLPRSRGGVSERGCLVGADSV